MDADQSIGCKTMKRPKSEKQEGNARSSTSGGGNSHGATSFLANQRFRLEGRYGIRTAVWLPASSRFVAKAVAFPMPDAPAKKSWTFGAEGSRMISGIPFPGPKLKVGAI
jgi:hypothetical protein